MVGVWFEVTLSVLNLREKKELTQSEPSQVQQLGEYHLVWIQLLMETHSDLISCGSHSHLRLAISLFPETGLGFSSLCYISVTLSAGVKIISAQSKGMVSSFQNQSIWIGLEGEMWGVLMNCTSQQDSAWNIPFNKPREHLSFIKGWHF